MILTQAIYNMYPNQFVIISNAYGLVRIETIYYASARYASILREKLKIRLRAGGLANIKAAWLLMLLMNDLRGNFFT